MGVEFSGLGNKRGGKTGEGEGEVVGSYALLWGHARRSEKTVCLYGEIGIGTACNPTWERRISLRKLEGDRTE